jgi:hypothetical protein
VETHIEMHRLQRECEEHGQRLELAVRARTRELAEANARLKILGLPQE